MRHPPIERCIQIPDSATRDDLIDAGLKPEAADEVLCFREYLRARKDGTWEGSFQEFKARGRVQ